MAYKDAEVGKARGRDRFHRRMAERLAAGLCTRCGREPPETGRKICQACAEKRRIADRHRDARLRDAGLPRRDSDRAREFERERSRRVVEERAARALCTKCGVNPPEDGRRWCEPCLTTRREDDRVRYQRAAASGLTYGGRDPEKKRRNARAASKRRREDRLAAGLCTRCGRNPAVEAGTTCEPCGVSRREAERETYAARKSAGLCVRCGSATTDGGSRCAPCAVLECERGDPERRNETSRKRYWSRRAALRCTNCNAPSQGAARCESCARRSYEKSDHFRGLPIYPPTFTVVLLGTDEPLGVFDDEMEVAAFLAFEKLARDKVEVLVDRSPMEVWTGWE